MKPTTYAELGEIIISVSESAGRWLRPDLAPEKIWDNVRRWQAALVELVPDLHPWDLLYWAYRSYPSYMRGAAEAAEAVYARRRTYQAGGLWDKDTQDFSGATPPALRRALPTTVADRAD